MWNSSHHDCSTERLSFSAQLSNCNVAKRWQVELSILSLLQLSFNIHSSRVQLSYQVLSFENSPWAGLGQILGRCLCNHRETLTKVQKVTFVENKDAVRKRLWICLSLHSCQTAMLPHVGKLNSPYSAFSNFHSTFIRAIGSVVLSSSFIWKQPLGWPWVNLGALLVQPQKNTDVQCLPLPVFPGRLSYANLH